MCKSLVKKYGGNFVELFLFKLVMDSEVRFFYVLQIYRLLVLSQEFVVDIVIDRGQVCLVGLGVILILVGIIIVLKGFVKLVVSFLYNVLVERVKVSLVELFSGVIVGVVVIIVGSKGRIFIQVVNFSLKDVYLNLRILVVVVFIF